MRENTYGYKRARIISITVSFSVVTSVNFGWLALVVCVLLPSRQTFARFCWSNIFFFVRFVLQPSNVFRNCREADESRLREVCESFLGPPIGMTESGSELKTPEWDPCILVRPFSQFFCMWTKPFLMVFYFMLPGRFLWLSMHWFDLTRGSRKYFNVKWILIHLNYFRKSSK